MLQLAPPHIHRRNAAERDICTLKNHFVSGLAPLENNFTIYLWCRKVKQAGIKMNLLLTSRTNPIFLVYAHFFGTFDFNTTPMAPPGKKVIAHEKPNQRAIQSKHVVLGWYIGPSLEHYRCYRIFATETRSERISKILGFFQRM